MITRWNDFEQTWNMMNNFRRNVDHLFAEESAMNRARAGATWPRVGLWDQGSNFVLLAELPGFTEKDFKLTAGNDALTLEGERKSPVPEGYSVHRQERAAARFVRNFPLPAKVDFERTTAVLKNGVLTVTLPKLPESQPRTIHVRTA